MPSRPKDQESHTGRNLAMGAAAVAPFGGMIGQKPLRHDVVLNPKNRRRFTSIQELSGHAQPGDILVTNKSDKSAFKRLITPMTGSEFYHTQPVVSRRKGHGLTTDIGMIGKTRNTIPSMLKDTVPVHSVKKDYDDVILLRPKKPLTSAQLKVFRREALVRAKLDPGYDAAKGVSSWVKDVFVPKIKGYTGQGEQFSTSSIGLSQAIDKNTFTAKGSTRPYSYCSGNICSTAPAMAHTKATGRAIIPGKAARDVFPTDFLRSDEYRVVGSHIKPEAHWNSTLRAASPYAVRAALGGAGAGAIYLSSEHPEQAGAVGGALAASYGAAHLNRLYSPSDTAAQLRLPGLSDVITSRLPTARLSHSAGPQGANKFLARWLTRKLPLAIAGGAAGYYGTKKLREKFKHA